MNTTCQTLNLDLTCIDAEITYNIKQHKYPSSTEANFKNRINQETNLCVKFSSNYRYYYYMHSRVHYIVWITTSRKKIQILSCLDISFPSFKKKKKRNEREHTILSCELPKKYDTKLFLVALINNTFFKGKKKKNSL